MKELLLSRYGYLEKDIVTLLDDGESPSTEPTEENILREIDALVHGAKAGDRFFFHYAGHGTQQSCTSSCCSEEDGMDEYIIPSDGHSFPSKFIKDNTLRKKLVDVLPVGSQLVAIFDCCNSETMLDLKHYRCNRVYVPWISKGRRRTNSLWNKNVRRLGLDNADAHVVTTRRVYQTKRVTLSSVVSKQNSIDQVLTATNERVLLRPKARSLSLKSTFVDRDILLDVQRCESPVAQFCGGFCPPETRGKDADVISLASCKDSQSAWEIGGKDSMTQMLVEILEKDPHPTLQDLMTKLKVLTRMHKKNRKYKDRWKIFRQSHSFGTRAEVETDNFQDPQMASLRPLDMNAPFSP
ncbi:peptidase C14, caspase domain-containing protein [Mycena floridula]|nr:peptidase C14, caspase domain-containing protein [Mycena floridula]